MFGGQSKLVVPKDGTGERPLPSHGWPFLRPPEQVPPLVAVVDGAVAHADRDTAPRARSR